MTSKEEYKDQTIHGNFIIKKYSNNYKDSKIKINRMSNAFMKNN